MRYQLRYIRIALTVEVCTKDSGESLCAILGSNQ